MRISLTSLALAALLLPAGAQASTAEQQQEAQRMLAPVTQFEAAAVAKTAQIEQHMKDWEKSFDSCNASIKKRMKKIKVSKKKQSEAGMTMFGLLLIDGFQEALTPLSPELTVAAQQYRQMQLDTPELQALAQQKAATVEAWLDLPQIDSCLIMKQWVKNKFRKKPEALRKLEKTKKLQKMSAQEKAEHQRIGSEGQAKLVEFGLSDEQAAGIADFPFGAETDTTQ